MNCKAIDGLIRYLTRVIPDGLLLSIAHVRFTWFNKCKRFAGLNFKCKLEVGLIIKTVNFFQDEAKNKSDEFHISDLEMNSDEIRDLINKYTERYSR